MMARRTQDGWKWTEDEAEMVAERMDRTRSNFAKARLARVHRRLRLGKFVIVAILALIGWACL